MQYDQIRYIPEDRDPSMTIETANLVAKIIDNTGLLLPEDPRVRSHFGRYGINSLLPYSHHLGYHGMRTLYDKSERRNLVLPLASWLNLQQASLAGIENDLVDERAWAGVGRGWPMRIERQGPGVLLTLEPRPNTQFTYRISFQPAEPDGIDFAIQFIFHARPQSGPARFRGSWPCYVNALDDVRFYYPQGHAPDHWRWTHVGEPPDMILGEPVGYSHRQDTYSVQDQAFPLGYGRIGTRALILMFNDPRVKFFVVNAGGHFPTSAIQNPAWDFEWSIDDYPLDTPVGFSGRLIYTTFTDAPQILRRYHAWSGLRPLSPVIARS